MRVPVEIKEMWDESAAILGVYETPKAAQEGWDRIMEVMARQEAKERIERAHQKMLRAQERERTTHRGLTAPVPTCARCFTQHRGEC